MLIPTVYCMTGSFFHYDGRKNDLICPFPKVVVGGYLTDVIVAIMAIIFGVSALLATANSLIQLQLPLYTKVISIVGGTVLLVGDTVFLIYRVERGTEEEENQLRKRLMQERLDKLGERSAAVMEGIQKLYDKIERLEKELIPHATKNLEEVEELIKEYEKGGLKQELKEALADKREIIETLKSRHENLSYYKAALENQLELQEKLESLTLG